MGTEHSHLHNENEERAGAAVEREDVTFTRRGSEHNLIRALSDHGQRTGCAVSPPISVCSDLDIPYVSYTDRPIGDSPKVRNKNPSTRRPNLQQKNQRPTPAIPRNIVVVKPAVRKDSFNTDYDIAKIQNIPLFLPVMRETASLPASRDPDILERLQSVHLHSICNRIQAYYHGNALNIAAEQSQICALMLAMDQKITKLMTNYVEIQKSYAYYAEQITKIRVMSQQLSLCNSLFNQNLQNLENINNVLNVEDRLEPFSLKNK